MFKVIVKYENSIIKILNFKTEKEATNYVFEEMCDIYTNHDYCELEESEEIVFEDAENIYWGFSDYYHAWFKSFNDTTGKPMTIYFEIKK